MRLKADSEVAPCRAMRKTLCAARFRAVPLVLKASYGWTLKMPFGIALGASISGGCARRAGPGSAWGQFIRRLLMGSLVFAPINPALHRGAKHNSTTDYGRTAILLTSSCACRHYIAL